MSTLVAGMASSHAYTFYEPAEWDKRRGVSYERYRKRFGRLPRIPEELGAADPKDDERRYAKLRDGFARLATLLAAANPDVLLLIGDDQHEHFIGSVPSSRSTPESGSSPRTPSAAAPASTSRTAAWPAACWPTSSTGDSTSWRPPRSTATG